MSIVEKIKSLLLNKNMVVILSVFAGIIVLWYIYTNQLNKVIKPLSVPIASHEIYEATQITSADITYVKVNSSFVKKANILTTPASILNKYVANGTSIRSGSVFYKEQVVNKADLIDRDMERATEGNTLYFLSVDFDSTYANSIYPGDKIDLWVKVESGGKILYEPFLTAVQVLLVEDGKGKNVFDGSGKRTPSSLVLDVSATWYKMYKKIEGCGGVKLYPVLRNKNYTESETETHFSSLDVKNRVFTLCNIYGLDL